MQVIRLAILQAAILLTLGSASFAQGIDFELAAHQSYRTALADAAERAYVEKFLEMYADSLALLLPGWADSYTLLGGNMPASGKPHQDGVVGICSGMAEYNASDMQQLSLRLLDGGVGTIADMNLFATVSAERISPRLARGVLRDADITFLLNVARMSGFEDVRMSWCNVGAAARKPIASERPLLGRWLKWSGASASQGVTYSRLPGREDIGNGFYSDIDGPKESLELVVDPDVGGKVTVAEPAWGQTSNAIVHYPFVEFNALAVQTAVRGYVNLLGALDVYSGFGLSLLPYSNIFLETASDVSLRLTDNAGLDSQYDGSVTAETADGGSRMLRTLQMGLMVSVGPVRLGAQVSQSLGTDNNSATGMLAYAW